MGIEPMMRVLQTPALPLGTSALTPLQAFVNQEGVLVVSEKPAKQACYCVHQQRILTDQFLDSFNPYDNPVGHWVDVYGKADDG